MELVTRPPRMVALAEARKDPAREPGELIETRMGTVHAIVRGSGSHVVLLHGVTDNAHTWHGVQAALSESARTHALDLPGHGLSDIPGGSLTARQMADWIAAYLEAVGIERAAVVGWSLGGAVAVALAADHPARVRSLVLEGAALLEFPFPTALWPLKVHGIAELMFRIAAQHTARRLCMASSFARGFVPHEDVVERYWRGWQVRGRAPYIRSLLRDFRTADTTPLVSRVRAPSWVVHGDEDRLVPSRIGRELRKHWPRSDLRALAGVGHAPHIERSDVVLGAIRDALSTS